MGGTDFMVDVEPIGVTANRDHLGTQFVEHLGCDLIRRTMGTIHNNLHALERQVIGERALAEFNVPARRVIEPTGAPQTRRVGPDRRVFQRSFDLEFPGVG